MCFFLPASARGKVNAASLECKLIVSPLSTLQGGPRKKRVVILLSANRSQTIGVLLSHLKMPHEDFRRAITSLDTRTLQPNFVVQLMKLLPTDQEVAALQSYTVSLPTSDTATFLAHLRIAAAAL